MKPLLIAHSPTALTISSSITNEQPLGIFPTLGSRTTCSLFTTVTLTYAIFVAPMEDITVKPDADAPHDLPESGHKRVNSDATERPTSAQRDRDESDQHSDVEPKHSASDDEDADPADQINPYDWDQLHQRYHNAINECNREEKELMDEWASLMEVILSLTS